MARRLQWIVVAIAALVLIAAGFLVYDRSRPIEEQIRSAKHIVFIGEEPVTDGGSHTFFFHLPRHRPMALKVRHRRANLGGNAEFQEIWIDRTGGMHPHLDLQPDSELESKIIALLSSASCETNAARHFTTPPQPERLQWVLERIRDRKTTW